MADLIPMKNSFSKKDIGAAVVFAGFDGGSYSATVTDVTADTVRVQYFPIAPLNGAAPRPVYSTVVRADWKRLTRFGAASFLAVEAPTH